MKPARLLWLLAPIAAGCGAPPNDVALGPKHEEETCRACHQQIVQTYVTTAHYRTSATGDSASVHGPFDPARSRLATSGAGVYFQMGHQGGRPTQTATDSLRGLSRTEAMEIVIGSGRKGQSYLYWYHGLLFQLPVSYLTAADRWINSPGYLDGQVDFTRLIPPRCLECHTTAFRVIEDGGSSGYSDDYRLGITCRKCHGDGTRHVAYHTKHPGDKPGREILSPARFSQEQRLDNCGLCHSGARTLKAQAFSYRPGERLDDYLAPAADHDNPTPDVHGNQIELLRRSRCFRNSKGMTCTTCHNVHRPERDAVALAEKCVSCHANVQHKLGTRIGARLTSACVDCHMPLQKSNAIQINTATGQGAAYYRSHAIAVYPAVSAEIVRSRPNR